MKLAVVLLLVASSIVAVYSLADPAPQSRVKPRGKSQFRSRTGTVPAIENKPKSEFLRESIRTPARESNRTPLRESNRTPLRESIRSPLRETKRQPTTTNPPPTTTENIIIPDVTTLKPEPKPRAIAPKLENNLIETNLVTEFPSYANATGQFCKFAFFPNYFLVEKFWFKYVFRTVIAPVPAADCQQNDLLNKLLLRVLLSSMMTSTTQNPLMENLNRLFNISPTPAAKPTTVVTSTVVSTVTQLFSTIVSVWESNCS